MVISDADFNKSTIYKSDVPLRYTHSNVDIRDQSQISKKDEIEKIEKQIELMKTYLLHKIEIGDWHGGYDSCIDIRCLAEKLQWIKESIKDDK